jgi:hypothetical protein
MRDAVQSRSTGTEAFPKDCDLQAYLDGKAIHDDGRVKLDISLDELVTLRAALRGAAQGAGDCGEEATYDRANTVPVAWIAFAGNGNIRLWTSDAGRAKEEKEGGLDLRAFTLAELVALADRSGDVAYASRQAVIEECAQVAEAQKQQFLSTQYAANQPFGSLCERFACDQVAEAIRALALPSTQSNGAAKWPADCHSPNSCRRNGRCMYVGCKHDGSESMKEPSNG